MQQNPEPGLNLETVDIPKESIQKVQPESVSQLLAVLAVVLLLMAIAGAIFGGRKVGDPRPPRFLLRQVPFSAKLGLTFLLLIYGATHALAAITVYLDTRVVYSSATEYFQFLSAARLTGLSHAHLMGISTMDAIIGSAFVLSRRSSGWVCGVVTMTFLGIVADIVSWWLTKYEGGGFELLSMATGIFFSLGFIIMSVSIFWDMWLSKERLP